MMKIMIFDEQIIKNDESLLLEGLRGSKGNVSFIKEKRSFGSINLHGSKQLNFDWWTNSADGEGIEFVLLLLSLLSLSTPSLLS